MTTSKKKVFLIVGRTGVGKSAIVRAVCDKLGVKQLQSYTTREPREKELKDLEKSDHIFIKLDEVKNFENDFAAYTEINGNSYFTTKKTLEECDCYVIDPKGIEDLKQRCKDEFDFITVYIRAPKQMLKERFVGRGETPEKFEERWSSENEQFSQFERKMDWSYHILNDRSFEEAVMKLEKFMRKELSLWD